MPTTTDGTAVTEADRATERALAGPDRVGHPAADDHDPLRVGTVGRLKHAAGHDRNLHGGEVLRIDNPIERSGALTRWRRRLIGALETANVFARPERQPGNACDAGDTRHLPQLRVELLVDGRHLRRRIARGGQRNGEDAQPGRIEPDVGVLHRRHAAQQQAGAEQQHHRETDFGDEQNRSRPSPSHRADGAALSQRLRQRRARQLQRWSGPEEHRRKHHHRQRERERADVERHFVETRQVDWREALQRRDAPEREQQTTETTGTREHEVLRQQVGQQPPPP